ncbi:4-hydroxy-tetrahydrodipicolinate synthase [Roseovarius pacificus]|uniref:4-hydroxy-tetrahydrodipicolinate synthase n=1 Tax=Roseovarius pacificus TaxID=337701 RepID=A0A1M7FM76_9RHOB|nr:dihydrodipicolinate synthase family protein [Roseovarius pacificus]GGO59231.1 dihydrodipicolinate synthase family protein [Roseovarius pacificus]SHM05164.1 4-hydroxy-tetrahydrodipicolinate synthase [Roseovarius pacificus]
MTDIRNLRGVVPYLPTPLTSDGAVDEGALRRLVDHLIGEGVHGVTPLGSTGEFAYLDFAAKERVVIATVEAAAGRVPVIAGVAATTTWDAIRQARRWAELGADGILAVMEAYFPVNEDGVVAYFTAVADATDLPVTLYTNPNFQRSDLSLDAIDRLSHHPNIVFVKDASTNTGRLLSMLNRTEGRIGVFAASSHITAAVMLIGGRGWLAGPSCLIPRQSVRLFELCEARQWDAAMELQRELWAVNQAFARFNLAGAVKAGLKLQGFDCGDPAPPQRALGPDEVAVVRRVLERVGAL